MFSPHTPSRRRFRTSYFVLRTCRGRRRGFTLVELLVVITIIIILMGLLTPVVINALTRAKEARILTEINILDGAFKTYKADVGAYPPSDFSKIGTASISSGNYSYTPANTPQYVALANHLQKAFPRCNVNTEIAAIILSNPRYPAANFPAPISPAQAIYFWLGGFCSDKEHPISGLLTISGSTVVPNSAATRNAPRIDFDKTRLTWPNGLPGTTAPCYCAADTPGVPYVYFASQNYDLHDAAYTGPTNLLAGTATPYDTIVWNQGGSGLLRPYAADPVPPTGKIPARVKPVDFQIISAGLDSDFGGGGIMDNLTKGNPVVPYFNSGTFYATGDKDNLTNFSSNTLGDSIPR